MKNRIVKKDTGLCKTVFDFEEQHPYRFAFIIAALFSAYIVFFTPSFIDTTEEINYVESLDVINLEEIRTQKRSVRKEINTDPANVNTENADVDKAQGTSDDADATDLAFLPNVVKPRAIGGVKKYYPKLAREENVEAVVYTQVLISKEGKVRGVKVKGIQLLKMLPDEKQRELKRLFVRDTRKSLMQTRFTPPVVQGKNVPVLVDFTLRFNLKE